MKKYKKEYHPHLLSVLVSTTSMGSSTVSELASIPNNNSPIIVKIKAILLYIKL